MRTETNDLQAADRLEYYLRPEEIWARAYAQFIAKRIKNNRAKIEISKMQGIVNIYDAKELQRRIDLFNDVNLPLSFQELPLQWSDVNFIKIDQEITRILEELKWMK